MPTRRDCLVLAALAPAAAVLARGRVLPAAAPVPAGAPALEIWGQDASGRAVRRIIGCPAGRVELAGRGFFRGLRDGAICLQRGNSDIIG